MSLLEDRAPREHKITATYQKKGLILVHTGNGKGKSTAAFGTALRALGRGWKVAIVQFIKGKWRTGEERAFQKFGSDVLFVSMGKGFTWETKNFDEDKRLADKTWQKCEHLLEDPKYALVIFDEINYVLHYGFLDISRVVEALQRKPPLKHVILTGAYAPQEIVEIADLVTEMKKIKHPYDQGLKAQPGIEY